MSNQVQMVVLKPRQRMTVNLGATGWPTYRSIKLVKAAKIEHIELCGITRINTIILNAGGRKVDIKVEDGWLHKHEPRVGGYIVVYEDGYASYSPAEPFESGYIKIDTQTAEPDRSNHAMLRREVQALANLLLGRTTSRALPSPQEVGRLLLNAIAMYGEPEPQTGTSGRVTALNQQEIMQKSGFEPNDKLAFDSLVSAMLAGVDPFSTVTVAPAPNVENEFYNWAVSHKLTHEGKPNIETIMQAFDEMVMQVDELTTHNNLFAGRNMTHGEVSVLTERARQVAVEGYTAAKDDGYTGSELVKAAACYLLESDSYPNAGQPPELWPWPAVAWKPKNYRHDLVRALALGLAELDRIDRQQNGKES